MAASNLTQTSESARYVRFTTGLQTVTVPLVSDLGSLPTRLSDFSQPVEGRSGMVGQLFTHGALTTEQGVRPGFPDTLGHATQSFNLGGTFRPANSISSSGTCTGLAAICRWVEQEREQLRS
jgi:hypothetical protein